MDNVLQFRVGVMFFSNLDGEYRFGGRTSRGEVHVSSHLIREYIRST